jgi:CheY-like chemotaxis protein
MQVLVVDDSKTARLQLKNGLQNAGHAVQEASSGAVALDMLLHGARVDLVITDQNMPDKSGIEMLAEIRAAKGCPNCDVKAIFLSSDASMELRAAAKDLGVKAFVSKPVSVPKLLELLGKI